MLEFFYSSCTIIMFTLSFSCSWSHIMHYHFDRIMALISLGSELFFLLAFHQYDNGNMMFVNLKQDVKELLLKAIEQVHLANQQKKTYLDKNWFLKTLVLPSNLKEKMKFTNFFWEDKKGATFDGVTFSNMLFFERERKCTGFLIKSNRELYNSLVTVRKKIIQY